jgi:hypothetical protein
MEICERFYQQPRVNFDLLLYNIFTYFTFYIGELELFSGKF